MTAVAAIVLAGVVHAAVGPAQISAAANHFLAQYNHKLAQQYGDSVRIESSIDRIDNRLSMPDCSVPIEAGLKSVRRVGRINIQVRCDGKSPWTLYLPANVKLFRPVVMAVAPVARGTTLAAGDLELREVEVSRLHGSYFTDIKEVAGMEARRLLSPDQPIVAAYLKPPVVIHRGDAVILTASSAGLTVKMPGVALGDGEKGAQISVRNSRSKRVVEAQVTGPGQVRVPM